MNWAAFPYLRIALSFTSGIFIYEYLQLSLSYCLLPFLALSILFFFGELFIKIEWPKSTIQGLLLLLSIFFAGGVSINYKKESLQKNILSSIDNRFVTIYGTVTEKLKSEKGTKLLVNIFGIKITDKKIEHKDAAVILKFGADDIVASKYKPGMRLILAVILTEIPKNTNPEAFDYAYYLKTKSIIQHGFVRHNQHKSLDILPENRIIKLASMASGYASAVLAKYIKDPETLGIAEAILLGQKLLLSDDIYKSYTNTGAIHVLSVSGLHVAIFISVFIWLFSLSSRQDLSWKLIKITTLFIIVWFYVILTGMSPSVVRAGVMVSLYIVGNNIFKGTNSYNILSIAAIVMLIYNPYYLFQVSFQFSFISLLSILYFQPKISVWWTPESKFLKFIWSLINVSIAAQILIFPVTIYYFHQFPVYFAVSGIVAVPLVTIIIYLGTFAILVEGIFSGINTLLGPLLDGMIKVLNYSIAQISNWPFSIIPDIWLSDLSLVLTMFIITIFILWWETRNLKVFNLLLIFSLVLTAQSLYYKNELKNYSHLFVYDTKGTTLVDCISDQKIYSTTFGVSNAKNITFAAGNNRLKHGIKSTSSVDKLPNLFRINNKMVYINNSIENPKYINYKSLHILIVTKNKYNSPDKLLSKFQPKIVVLDGNLPPWIEEKWLSLRPRSDFKIHNIKTDGSFQYFFND